MTTTEAKTLLAALGHDPRLYVADSLVAVGSTVTWTEKCRPRCRHDDGICHHSRSGYLPPEHRT